MTNHLLHTDAHAAGPPIAESLDRLARLEARIEAERGPTGWGREGIRRAHRCVAAQAPVGAGQCVSAAPARTLWYAEYDLARRALRIDFYLGDAPGGGVRRSAAQTLTLGRLSVA